MIDNRYPSRQIQVTAGGNNGDTAQSVLARLDVDAVPARAAGAANERPLAKPGGSWQFPPPR